MAFTRLQIKGITSHAWPILSAKKTNEGYILSYLDSNTLKIEQINYASFTSFQTSPRYGRVVPYLAQKSEFRSIKKTIATFCK